LADCQHAHNLSPDSTDWLLCSAEVYIKQRNWKQAINTCNKLLEKQPHSVTAHRIRAIAFNELGNFEGAASDASAAIWRDPADAQAYAARAYANYHLSKIDDAHYDARQAINIDPNLAKSNELRF
jgi:Flp pilus assembly protein TadD